MLPSDALDRLGGHIQVLYNYARSFLKRKQKHTIFKKKYEGLGS